MPQTMTARTEFSHLEEVAGHFRDSIQKKTILLYAHNGIGKTRLSTAFKDLGKNGSGADTLYFNAFTEDLFRWENDLEGDCERFLKLNAESKFFQGLETMEMDNRIRPNLAPFADFDFVIDTEKWEVRFFREVFDGQTRTVFENIKISRGEESIFIWSFYLAIVQLALDGNDAYDWVKFIYIDDPISSLDENNVVTLASTLGRMIKETESTHRFVISTHHGLFFNVLCNELGKAPKFCLSRDQDSQNYLLNGTGEDAVHGHIAELLDLKKAASEGTLASYHFNRLRSVMERAATFHGYTNFAVCMENSFSDHEDLVYKRLIDIFSHGNHSFFEPRQLTPDNRRHFEQILDDCLSFYPFNQALFLPQTGPAS